MPTMLGYYGYFTHPRPDLLDQFQKDERAIEGLPIRLVIALVVGVASLGVMMNMLTNIECTRNVQQCVNPWNMCVNDED